ncbi:MAG: hypothetical protein KF856_02245 [Cyclobacteriaceae bacterium]|nr:hypothetical protein [Cyclobacteriaceae bacterium]
MKRLGFLIMLIISTTAMAQQQGIGLRLGDPTGVTYKKYLGRTRAVEFGIGSAPAQWHNNYYINSFEQYPRFDNYRYQNHTVQSTVYLQGRYLFQYNIPVENMEGSLAGYWGAGALLKAAQIQYRFQNREAPFASGRGSVNDLDLGPEGIIGLEYTFQDTPLTVFGETSVFLEIADRPATIRAFGGLGVRYNFFKR